MNLINCSTAALSSERYAQPDHTFGPIDNILKLCVMYIKAKIWLFETREKLPNYCFPSDTKKSTDPIILWKRKSFLWDHVIWHRASAQKYTSTPGIWFWKKIPSARKPQIHPSALNHRQKSKQLFFELCEKPQEPRLFLPKVYKIPWLEHSEQSSPFPLKQFFSN